jgi:hypothetical protein
MSFLIPDELSHELSHFSQPGRRAVRVTKYCEYCELFNEAKIVAGVIIAKSMIVSPQFGSFVNQLTNQQ